MAQDYSSSPIMPQTGYAAPAMGASADVLRISQMEQQIRDLTGQLEQRDYQIRQLQESFDRYVADTNMRIQDLESRGGGAPAAPVSNGFDSPASDAPLQQPASPPQPSAPQPGVTSIPGTLPDQNAPYQPSATPPLGQINEAAPVNNGGTITSGRAQGTGNAAQAYDQAFGFLQQSNYSDAENAFQNFLKTYPTHPLAANAQYWLGETYFAQTQYSTAAKIFAKAFQDYPKGQKAPDALLKLSITLDKMNKRADACLTLKELRKRFPSGPASVLRRADEENQRMACSV